MIKQVDITDKFTADNLFLVKIKSNSLCFKKFEFCRTFSQEIYGEITAYINILSANATVYLYDNAEREEIKDFLLFYGVKNVFCNDDFCAENKGVVLKYASSVISYNDDSLPLSARLNTTAYPDYKSVYALLKTEFSMPDYNEFVSDLSFRLNHNSARLIQTDGGACYTLWETENSAVISALAVDITKRGSGLGTVLLKSITDDLLDKKQDIYIYCEEKLKDFYIKNGFVPTGEYFTGEFK